jgi:CubicO group peptidase (beta-lactamase class C family)
MPDQDDLARALATAVQEVSAPGAVLAVASGGEVHEAATGIANVATGAELTPDTLFPVASITKVFTATLVMQLVDDGLLDLDRPVRGYLPGFAVADPQASAAITARHLLTHTAGIGGDKEDTFGRGDDALARYVADCATLEQTHPPGATVSYCNSGFIVLGHLVATLRGATWDDVLGERIFAPLGMTRGGTLPEHVIWHRLAAPHQSDDDGGAALLPVWEAERSHGPAGGVVTSARQLLDFARVFTGTSGGDQRRVLSADSVRAMTTPQVELPNRYEGETHQGLGWAFTVRPGEPMWFGHGGDLLGHHSWLVVCPERDFAAALLVNGDGMDSIERAVLRPLLADLGVTMPDPPGPAADPPDMDLAALAGTYETPAVRIVIRPEDDSLAATFRVTAPRIAELLPESQRERRMALLPVSAELFVTRNDPDDPWTPAVFSSADGQRYLHIGGRAVRRIGEVEVA